MELEEVSELDVLKALLRLPKEEPDPKRMARLLEMYRGWWRETGDRV